MFANFQDTKKRLDAGEVSSLSLVEDSLAKIKASDLGSVFLSNRGDAALKEAKEADTRRSQGKQKGLLDGIPIAIKDNVVMENEPARCASKMLETYVSPYDATVVSRLKSAGAIIVGRTNMDEFAMGSSNEHSAFGVVKNPWDPARVPGGSSGGSAAAVAAGLVPVALGSDTGGSIRQPASLCGAVGVKPTYGRVSRYGLIAFASSLDQIGPITWYVEDSAAVLSTIAGFDALDSTSSQKKVPNYLDEMAESVAGLRVGVATNLDFPDLDEDVRNNFKEACAALEKLGAKIVDVELPYIDQAVGCYYVIASAEASANLSRFDGVRYSHRSETANDVRELFVKSRSEGFGNEVKRRIMLGTYVLSSGYYDAYYSKANEVRKLIYASYDNAFANCDVIVTPTSPFTAFKIGEKVEDPLKMYLCDIFTTSVSLAGLPAISVPSGFSNQSLPFGLQVIAPPFQEGRMFQVAYHYQQSQTWKDRRPS